MKKRIKAVIFLFMATASLFAISSIYSANHNPMLIEDTKEINSQQVSPQKLFETTWQTIKNEYFDSTYNSQYWNKWKYRYKNKVKTIDDAKVVIDTMLESLEDPYTRFLTRDEFIEQNNSILSKLSGIGVNIINDSGKIKILNVMENTPAQFADIKVNDILMAVDDVKVSGLTLAEVSNLVKGPVNTFVELELLRGGELIKKRIIRKEITIKTVKSSVMKNIGYIQISSFISNSTPNEFIEALENTEKTDGLIIDLRGNTGGLLPNAVFISNIFIPEGKIVSIVGRNGYKYDILAQDNEMNIKKPIVLLVDKTSASASEIFSAAMKDYNKAKIIGTKTFGKGLVQKIIPMPNETGLNLTVAKYITPKGNDINKIGIEPDVYIKLTKSDFQNKKDTQLEKAKEVVQEMINN